MKKREGFYYQRMIGLGKPTAKSTHWKWVKSSDGKKWYLIEHSFWTGPMCVYHILRKTAIMFDSFANKTRALIRKLEKNEFPQWAINIDSKRKKN